MIDPRRLRVLHAVADHGTLAAAAAALHLTPPAISQQLNALERETGHRMVARAGRGIRLTSAAELLLRHAVTIHAELERAEVALAEHDHGRIGRVRLAGFKQEACIDCHTDKGGPFIFEHGSSKVDGCVACHTPHGSVNRHMLTFQATGDLCYSCHAVLPSFHGGTPQRFTANTNCTNCHSSIHGSNFDPFFMK